MVRTIGGHRRQQELREPNRLLQHARRTSGAGDTIFLLPSDSGFEGGLALKLGQSLIGLNQDGRKPVITNSDLKRNGGCGNVLADNTLVSNVRIEHAVASGICGSYASDVRIDGVDVHGANRSESYIEPKYLPSPGHCLMVEWCLWCLCIPSRRPRSW